MMEESRSGLFGNMKRLEALEELLNGAACSAAELCSELADVFGVAVTDVGLLRLDGHDLRFVFPPELQVAGTIPLSSSAVAAQTAVSKLPECFNLFASVPHHNVFETVRLRGTAQTEAPTPIQKLMSAPILNERNDTLGVVQVCRKGISPAAAGPDFTADDLETLERSARRIAYLLPEILSSKPKSSSVKLSFLNTTLLKKKA